MALPLVPTRADPLQHPGASCSNFLLDWILTRKILSVGKTHHFFQYKTNKRNAFSVLAVDLCPAG